MFDDAELRDAVYAHLAISKDKSPLAANQSWSFRPSQRIVLRSPVERLGSQGVLSRLSEDGRGCSSGVRRMLHPQSKGLRYKPSIRHPLSVLGFQTTIKMQERTQSTKRSCLLGQRDLIRQLTRRTNSPMLDGEGVGSTPIRWSAYRTSTGSTVQQNRRPPTRMVQIRRLERY